VGLRDTVSFHGASAAFDPDGHPREDAADAAAGVLLEALVWWARTLRRARAERAQGVLT
jgi:hypothetical protein